MPSHVYLGFESAELLYAWAGIRAEFKDVANPCPDTGEVWQYMGSFKKGSWWWHNFRHHNHPDFGERITFNLPATKTWVDEQNG